MNRIHRASRTALLGLLASALTLGSPSAGADSAPVGINVVLNQDVTESVLADLGQHGSVLDVFGAIRGVTLRADASELVAIRALPYVAAADEDLPLFFEQADGVSVPDFVEGENLWNLDAIDVTDAGDGRAVDFTGEGVYVAVLDTGLPFNWRAYYPEERIDTVHARAFCGGGGEKGTVSSQPEKWEHDTGSHGNAITGVILGFDYLGLEHFSGVAPRATVIPVKTRNNNHDNWAWASTSARGFLYVAELKASGELGSAPVVVNVSFGGPQPNAMMRAAIDYAIAKGVIVVAGAGNSGEATMGYPAAYPEVISVGASGWARQFPADDPTSIWWMVRDVPEGDPSEHFVLEFSSRPLPGQDLDVLAPGAGVATPWTVDGRPDYTFFWGTSAACPHVVGVAALLLEKNPDLTQSQIEGILESTALPLPPGCQTYRAAYAAPGRVPSWNDHDGLSFANATACWGSSATGHGLVQAAAALSVTPTP